MLHVTYHILDATCYFLPLARFILWFCGCWLVVLWFGGLLAGGLVVLWFVGQMFSDLIILWFGGLVVL